MFKLIIIFAGLITHVGLDTPTHQRAVLVKENSPKHRPILMIKKTDIDPASPLPASNESFARISGGPADETWFSLDGQDVRVVGVPLGATTIMPNFKTSVVHLKEVTTGNLRKLDSKVLSGDISHGAMAAFVKYDGGTIDLQSSFKVMATFSGIPNPPADHCVACEVVWTSSPTPSTVVDIVAESGKWVRVKSNATLHITHLPVDPNNANHFHKFKSLLSNVNAMATISQTATPCSPKCPASKGVTVECTNTQWP